MKGKANELPFQNDMIKHLVANGWLLGKPENYNRELALYPEDLLGFVQETQDAQWQKFRALYPNNPEEKFLERVASQLNKADANAANKLDISGTNNAAPKEDIKNTYQYIKANEKSILNEQHSLKNYDISIQITSLLGANVSSGIGAAAYVAIISAIYKRNLKPALGVLVNILCWRSH